MVQISEYRSPSPDFGVSNTFKRQRVSVVMSAIRKTCDRFDSEIRERMR